MALILKDRVVETTASTGTGTITLLGAVTGYQPFSEIGDGNTTYYTITDSNDWEVGIGTYTSSGNTLSRDTVLGSSNGGSKVDFIAGSKDVFVTYPASKTVTIDRPETLTNKTVDLTSNTLSGTKVQFDSACSDGNFVYTDAIGVSVQAYDPDLTTWGSKAAPTGTVVGTTDTQVLTNKTIDASNNTLSNIGGSSLSNSTVTYSKLQNVSATSRVLGRKTAGAGVTEEITLSELLDFVGSAAQGDLLYRGASGWTRLAAGTSGQYLKTQGAGANPIWGTLASSGFTLGTPVDTTSGSAIDFTGIPSTAKMIIVQANGTSFNGTSKLSIRVGTAGTPKTSGYTSFCVSVGTTAASVSAVSDNTGFVWNNTSGTGGKGVLTASVFILTLVDSSTNTWNVHATATSDAAQHAFMTLVGTVSLTGALDIVRLYGSAGSAFDAGKANIMYI